jgi:hypothetical protein
MTSQNKTTTGAKGKSDYITQLKKEADGVKETKVNETEDLDWERNVSEEEEEAPTTTTKKGVIEKQGIVGTNKARNLKDLLEGEKPIHKTKKPTDG